MSGCDFRSEDILFKEALIYDLLQVLPEGPTMDGLMSLAFVVRTIFLWPGEWRTVLEWSRMSGPWLIFDSVEDFIIQELQQTEAFHRSVPSKRIQGEDRKWLLLVSGLSLILILNVSGSSRADFDFPPHYLILRSDWRKSLSPLQVGWKAELEKGPHLSWWCCASEGVCIRGEPLATH